MTARSWAVHLAAAAESDFGEIVGWTAQRFDANQAHAYAQTLSTALAALANGPESIGARPRGDLGNGLHTLHVATRKRRGRHFIVFRMSADKDRPTIDVLRILHDTMDLARQLASDEQG